MHEEEIDIAIINGCLAEVVGFAYWGAEEHKDRQIGVRSRDVVLGSKFLAGLIFKYNGGMPLVIS